MNADQIAKRITGFIAWALNDPLGFMLWFTASIVIIVLFLHVWSKLGIYRLPTFGTPQDWIYTAGALWLIKGAR